MGVGMTSLLVLNKATSMRIRGSAALLVGSYVITIQFKTPHWSQPR